MDMNKYKCPLCNSYNVRYDRELNGYVCTNCGYVFPNQLVLDSRPSFKEINSEEKDKANHRVKHITTIIAIPTYETKEEKFIKSMRVLIDEIREFLPTLKDNDVKTAYTLLNRLVYNGIYKRKWRRGALALALVLLSIRLNGGRTPRNSGLDKYLRKIGANRREVRRIYKEIKEILGVKIRQRAEDEERELLTKFYQKFGFDNNVRELIRSLYSEVKRLKIGIGKPKKTVIAAIVYIAYKLYEYDITQKDVAKVAEITEIPLRNMIRDILQRVYIEILV